ncbi:MAG: hypothetical protein D6729_13260, partial [Deltaproteobacteria bacterium]
MAKVFIKGIEYDVRVNKVIEHNYAVSVLDNLVARRATVNLGARRPVLLRYKIHAESPEAAMRAALRRMEKDGLIDRYVLEPHEEKKEDAPEAAAAPSPAGAGGATEGE